MRDVRVLSGAPLQRRFRRLGLQVRLILAGRRVRPFRRHCLLAFPLATVPAFFLIFVGLAVLAVLGVGLPEDPPIEIQFKVWHMLGVILIGPLLETFLLAMGLVVLSAITRRVVVAAALSAVLWGALHGLAAPFWFVGTVWPFYVFSISCLAWWPHSFRHGFTAALVPHVLNNAFVVALIALEQMV